METAPLEVTVVAASAEHVELHLVDTLRREGIAVLREVGAGWPPAPAGDDHVYLWFPGAPLEERSVEQIAAWLDAPPSRPAVLAVGDAAQVEPLLAAGLDDAVPRTISERELVARVRALHRRVKRQPREGQLRYGALALDTVERTAWTDGVLISITPIEQAVLVALLRARGAALSRSELLEAAWGDVEMEISERAVDNVILRLRRKLPDPQIIETVRGVGFRLASSDRGRATRRGAPGDDAGEELGELSRR